MRLCIVVFFVYLRLSYICGQDSLTASGSGCGEETSNCTTVTQVPTTSSDDSSTTNTGTPNTVDTVSTTLSDASDSTNANTVTMTSPDASDSTNANTVTMTSPDDSSTTNTGTTNTVDTVSTTLSDTSNSSNVTEIPVTSPDASDSTNVTEVPTTSPGDSDTTSVSIVEATTADPCAGNCEINTNTCPNDCNCSEGTQKTTNGYCAEPCDPDYPWCSYGEECVVQSGKGQCSCGAGYYKNEEGAGCLPGKQIGGTMVFNDDLPENDTEAKLEIESLIDGIYNDTDGFVRSEVLDLRSGSIIADYKLIFEANSNVDQSTLSSTFYNQTENCTGNYAIEVSPGVNYTINCSRTEEVLFNDAILCELESPCDNKTTNCSTPNGVFWCQCKEGYTKAFEAATSCIAFKCTKDGDCNSPFGVCNKSNSGVDDIDNACICDWGFAGETCSEPWEFVFTIVSAGLGLILIIFVILLVYSCCTGNKSSKKAQSLEDLNLTNPFVDFQPGIVRAKLPSNLYNISDSLDAKENGGNQPSAKRNSYANEAYSHAYDSLQRQHQSKKNSFHQYESTDLMAPGKSDGAEYF